jgi:hypothetical protein
MIKILCVPAAGLSLVLLLYSCIKAARLETEPRPAPVQFEVPGAQVKAEPLAPPGRRQEVMTLFGLSALGLVGSIGLFGFAAWKTRSGRTA